MEAGLSEVKSELQSRDDLLRIIEMERLQLHRELLKIGEYQNAQENKKRYIFIFGSLRKLFKKRCFTFEAIFCINMLLIIR